MNGDKFLADTNALIYLLEQRPVILNLLAAEWSYCFISKIELLGKPAITKKELAIFTELLEECILVPHSERINELAIMLKQRYAIKTPDALIAATAMHHNLPLLTGDLGFERVKNELDVMFIKF